MRKVTYLDIDRQGNGYLLNVTHSLNKKNEPVDTITQVSHLGALDHYDYTVTYEEYTLWPRCIDSGDFDNYLDYHHSFTQ